MRKRICAFALMVAAVVCLLSQNAPAQLPPFGPGGGPEKIQRGPKPDPATLTDAQVMDSVKKGVDFLLADVDRQIKEFQQIDDAIRTGKLKRQLSDYDQPYGELVLATYSLLHVGLQTDDPRLRATSEQMAPLVKMITKLDSQQTYTCALQACALSQLSQKPETKKAMTLVVNKLMAGLDKNGGYTYPLNRTGMFAGLWDNSNSQYGLLGVWAAAEWGIETRNQYWLTTDAFWRKYQCRDGGWDYVDGTGRSTLTMTAAGVASLFICQEYVDTVPHLDMRFDKNIDAGLLQLITTFDPDSTDLYYLYGVERVGLASGLKFFKKTNWYREAAAGIIALQKDDGSYQAAFIGSTPSINTSYALLFLVRGRAPVPMNKLQYPGPWDARPRDAANLTAAFAHNFEKHLNWQIVGVDAPVDDWLDAPILLITGSRDPEFTPDEIMHLREFINAGGIIFSVADGERAAFTDAIKKIAAKVSFGQYEMRVLPKEHPLFSMDAKFKGTLPKVMAMSNGVRELWVHVPSDYGAIWQARQRTKTEAWDIPMNLYFYATGKGGLRSKLQSLSVLPPKQDPTRRIDMARLSYAGNWDPEPGGWARMAKLMAAKYNTKLDIQEVKLAKLNTAKTFPEIALLTGTSKLKLKDDELSQLRRYIADGGTLILEAAGGNDDFAASAMDIVKEAWPDAIAETLPPEHELFTAFSPDAAPIPDVEFRKSWTLTHGNSSKPRLLGIKIGGRLAVFVSAEDFSSGLLGTNTWGINGYTAASSEALARNLVFWSVHKPDPNAPSPAPAASQPATQSTPIFQPVALPPATEPAPTADPPKPDQPLAEPHPEPQTQPTPP